MQAAVNSSVGGVAALLLCERFRRREVGTMCLFVKEVDPDTLVIGAPAKINLFLQVLRRRSDGYHDINSVFQAVSLFDRLRLSRIPEPEIRLTVRNQPHLPANRSNLVWKAWELVRANYPQVGGISVELEKNIPIAAGMGGGSSDAAALLLGTSLLYGLNIPVTDLAALGAAIGSDVPFFFSHGQAVVTGRGEVIEEIELPTDYWLALVTPPLEVSTASAYAALALTEPKSPFNLASCRSEKDLVRALTQVGNDFEAQQAHNYPVIRHIRDTLLAHGAVLSRLTGSGPTVFGVFEQAPSRELESLSGERSWQIHVVRPVTRRSLHPAKGGSRGDHRDSGNASR